MCKIAALETRLADPPKPKDSTDGNPGSEGDTELKAMLKTALEKIDKLEADQKTKSAAHSGSREDDDGDDSDEENDDDPEKYLTTADGREVPYNMLYTFVTLVFRSLYWFCTHTHIMFMSVQAQSSLQHRLGSVYNLTTFYRDRHNMCPYPSMSIGPGSRDP